MPAQNKILAEVQPHKYLYSIRDEQVVFQSQSIYWVTEKHVLNNETGIKDEYIWLNTSLHRWTSKPHI